MTTNEYIMQEMSRLPTPEEIRRHFERRGLSIAEWARVRGFSTALVYQVLSGQRKGLRGQSHRIAVALGLKEGLMGEISDLPFETKDAAARRPDGAAD